MSTRRKPAALTTRREAQIQRALAGTLSRARRSDLTAELFDISDVLDQRARNPSRDRRPIG